MAGGVRVGVGVWRRRVCLGHPLRASLRLLASPYAEAKGTVVVVPRLASGIPCEHRFACSRPLALKRRGR